MREPILLRLIRFSQRHSLAVIAAALLITGVLGYFALGARINPDVLGLIPKDDRSARLFKEYGQGRVTTDWLVMAVEADDPFTPGRLAALAEAIRRIEALPHVRRSINPFNLVTFERDGRQLEVVSSAPGGRPPRSPEEIAALRQRLARDPLAHGFLMSADGRMLTAFFPLDQVPGEPRGIMRPLPGILEGLKGHFRVYITGPLPFEDIARRYLGEDLPRLMLLAALFILVVYYIGFRSLRAVVLPFLVVVFGTVWTVGLMTLCGFTLSIVSIMTPPLVLTLGSSYSIHVLNEYYREAKAGTRDPAWIGKAVLNINQTIVLASLTTIAGFISLLATTMSQTREFGIATSFGIVACALLALFFFPAALARLKPPDPVQSRRVLEGPVARMMERLSRFVLRARVPIILSVIVIGAAFGLLFDSVRRQSDYMAYFPEREPVVQDTLAITRQLGGFATTYLTLTAPQGRKNYFLEPQVLKQVSRLEERIKSNPDICYQISFVSYLKVLNRTMTGGEGLPENRGLTLLLARYFKALAGQARDGSMIGLLANEDFTRLTIAFRDYNSRTHRLLWEGDVRRLLAKVENHIGETLSPEIRWEMWGSALMLLSLSDILNRNWIISTLISIVLIFLINTFSFRTTRYGLFSLVPLVAGIMLNFIIMAVARIPLDMTTAMFTNLACGVGVDNAIHLIIQFRRQLALTPDDLEGVLARTMKSAGRPILLTTASVVVGLLVLTFASFLPIRYFGLLVALALLNTSLGALILLPAILSAGCRRDQKQAAKRSHGRRKTVERMLGI